MKIIALGDTHGRTDWKEIVSAETFDKVVFIGDYFDTHENIAAFQQIQNFKEIVQFKRDNKDKVVLLFGNHDFHYLSNMKETYSGFQEMHKFDIEELLVKALNEGLIQMCYVYDKFLFTHAGVSKTWCSNEEININDIENSINYVFYNTPSAFKYSPGEKYNPYGDEVCQTPLWIRPRSLQQDAIDNYVQVVGHTTQDELILNPHLLLIDTLGTSGEYLIIEDCKPRVSCLT